MPNKLAVIQNDVLSQEERIELDKILDRIILQNKDNRQEINHLVFESVTIMTEADDAQYELSNRSILRRLIERFTGSNQNLQVEISANHAAVQYASQQTLRKLAEQNLMTYDLITAVKNKLNASINAVNDEFKNIYDGLNKFLKYNQNKLARIGGRLAKVEHNVDLLAWQKSIEYQEYDGEKYMDLAPAKKIVCLVRDFYDITNGNWATSDLLLLKTAMSAIRIKPKDQVNYFCVLREISSMPKLKQRLLGNMEIRPIEDPSYLISMGTIEKLGSLDNRESYLVDTIMDYIFLQEAEIQREDICERLTYNYFWKRANVNLNIEVESYDLILDLLYNLKQAQIDGLLLMPIDVQESVFKAAEELFLYCKMEEAALKFQVLAENGNARAMYFLGELYGWALPRGKLNREYCEKWRKKGADLNDVLCRVKTAYAQGISPKQQESIINGVKDELIELANAGDMFAQSELGSIYQGKDDDSAIKWYRLSADQGYFRAMNILGNLMYNKGDYEDANKWYEMAGKAGDSWGWYNLAGNYRDGKGVSEDKDKAIELYKKIYELHNDVSGDAANRVGIVYHNLGNYEEANKWYEKSSEAGFEKGLYNLANSYSNGEGVGVDIDKAIELYTKVYNLKGELVGNSANNIGNLHFTRGNYEEANNWYLKAGEAGFIYGWFNLANDYYYGRGVPSNYLDALKLYEKAFECDGDLKTTAAYNMTVIYRKMGAENSAKKWDSIGSNTAIKWPLKLDSIII